MELSYWWFFRQKIRIFTKDIILQKFRLKNSPFSRIFTEIRWSESQLYSKLHILYSIRILNILELTAKTNFSKTGKSSTPVPSIVTLIIRSRWAHKSTCSKLPQELLAQIPNIGHRIKREIIGWLGLMWSVTISLWFWCIFPLAKCLDQCDMIRIGVKWEVALFEFF